MKKVTLAIILIAAIIVGALVYRTYNKPHRDIATEDLSFSLTADELFDAFEADEAAANALYLDKVVKVTGKVADVTENSAGQAVITITATNAMLGGVSATLQEGGMVNVSEGDAVAVKCRCTGFLMDVVLINCTLE